MHEYGFPDPLPRYQLTCKTTKKLRSSGHISVPSCLIFLRRGITDSRLELCEVVDEEVDLGRLCGQSRFDHLRTREE